MFQLNAAVVIRTKMKKFEQTHRHVEVNSCLVSQLRMLASLVLRPSAPPVFDEWQYQTGGGKRLGTRLALAAQAKDLSLILSNC